VKNRYVLVGIWLLLSAVLALMLHGLIASKRGGMATRCYPAPTETLRP
jgi:hypothetical protein